ncbi:hypothetical protein [Gorillibacterium massiliense]|uniref:hypothetical protein n=1 Tax=Gorillibacterium massiliense TaxID=1280390 RepID=UPI0005930180|nr:hypothetical protein [Gorillibacterium massiliense]
MKKQLYKLDGRSRIEVKGAVFSQLWKIQDFFTVRLSLSGELWQVIVGDARLLSIVFDNFRIENIELLACV